MKLILISSFSFLISYALINSLLPFFEKYFLTNPNLRSSHKKPLPTGGGIIFSFTSAVFSLTYGWYVPLICLPISLIGFADDKLSISKLLRYFSQVFTAFLLIYFCQSKIINLGSMDSKNLFFYFIIFVFVIFVMTAIINFFNFMDGIDGLVASIFSLYLFYLCLTDSTNKIFLLCSLIAFLVFNWMPAKIFMGDAGSTFIGSVYLGTLLEVNDFHELFLRFIILTPLLGDALFTLFLRLVNKQNIFKAHKLHLYQRLNQAGMDHAQVSLLYLGSSSLLCLISIHSLLMSTIFAFLIMIFGFYLNKNKAVPFNKYY